VVRGSGGRPDNGGEGAVSTTNFSNGSVTAVIVISPAVAAAVLGERSPVLAAKQRIGADPVAVRSARYALSEDPCSSPGLVPRRANPLSACA